MFTAGEKFNYFNKCTKGIKNHRLLIVGKPNTSELHNRDKAAGKPTMSWLKTERNWCWSGNWVTQSQWSQTSQPRFPSTSYFYLISESARHSALFSLFHTPHPTPTPTSSRQPANPLMKQGKILRTSEAFHGFHFNDYDLPHLCYFLIV